MRDRSHLSAQFGAATFGFELMKERLPGEFYDKMVSAIREGRPICPETADVVAHAMKTWAVSVGATHYTHWFQPLTGLTAEKHDSFLAYDGAGRVIERFTGRQLIMSEPDASSFPHGGLRSTFEARGYAAWDPSSPAFVLERGASTTLCLPSVYVSYTGEVLDKKTPLLRSIDAVSAASVRMLRLLGNRRVSRVTPHLGAEQEYFLIHKELFDSRRDLSGTGATLLGAGPARDQALDAHYFRAIPDAVLDFMEEVEQELVRLGVPVKTRHNEVAPAQFELAVLYGPVNIAADQNQLVMETLKRVAPRHGLEALLHEKPFARVNGSGKHNNWSLIDSDGTNLLNPGGTSATRLRFLIFLMAVVRGIWRHGDLLRGIAASHGNDLRLGGHEAPPAIMSVHLGAALNGLLDDLAVAVSRGHGKSEEIDLGIAGVAKIPKDTTDRNRTSPFAFTGDKFEFRAVGSSAAVSLPNAVINAMVAESLDDMCADMRRRMDDGQERRASALSVLSEVIEETEAVRFDGDNYSESWLREARRRGLGEAPDTPSALRALDRDETKALFGRYGLITAAEVEARHRIRLDTYRKSISVELGVMIGMLSTQILPAAQTHQERSARSVLRAAEVLGAEHPALRLQRAAVEELAGLVAGLMESIELLRERAAKLEGISTCDEGAAFCANVVRPSMNEARRIADRLEEIVDADLWPLRSYDEILTL